MKIGIDARFIGPQGTGLGKYSEKLIINLQKIDLTNQYVIFLRKNNWNFLEVSKNFTKVLADIPWYSLWEQIKLPNIFTAQNLDLLHVPHFNVPIFYGRKFVVTIHDLIHHDFKDESVTTKNPFFYKIKRFGYHKIINHAIKNSQKILVPSNFIKQQIIERFKISSQKIVVTYEAAEEEYERISNFKLDRFPSGKQISNLEKKNPFLLYVGNAYPHKNLNKLLDALKILTGESQPKLVLVCPRDVFWHRLLNAVKERDLEGRVEMKGYLEPEELNKLLRKSSAYICPSLSEGFGIPGLNAMAVGLPVVASNIPVLREVYDDAALYFDPADPKDIANKIIQAVSDSALRSRLVDIGRRQAQKYSWLKMARETLEVYQSVVHH